MATTLEPEAPSCSPSSEPEISLGFCPVSPHYREFFYCSSTESHIVDLITKPRLVNSKYSDAHSAMDTYRRGGRAGEQPLGGIKIAFRDAIITTTDQKQASPWCRERVSPAIILGDLLLSTTHSITFTSWDTLDDFKLSICPHCHIAAVLRVRLRSDPQRNITVTTLSSRTPHDRTITFSCSSCLTDAQVVIREGWVTDYPERDRKQSGKLSFSWLASGETAVLSEPAPDPGPPCACTKYWHPTKPNEDMSPVTVGWRVTVLTHHNVGDCLSPYDWRWKALSSSSSPSNSHDTHTTQQTTTAITTPSERDMSIHPTGCVRGQWTQAVTGNIMALGSHENTSDTSFAWRFNLLFCGGGAISLFGFARAMGLEWRTDVPWGISVLLILVLPLVLFSAAFLGAVAWMGLQQWQRCKF